MITLKENVVMNKNEEMVMQFREVIMSAFNGSGQHDVNINLKEIAKDGEDTQMIINMIKGLSIAFQELTGESMSHFEFIHVANKLIMQDLIDRVKEEESGD